VLAGAGVLTFALAGLGKSVLALADEADKDNAKSDDPVVQPQTANQKDDPQDDQVDPEEELIGGVFREVTAKNVAKLLGDQRSRRMIYLYKDKEGLGQVA